jgi:acyl carrier protein
MDADRVEAGLRTFICDELLRRPDFPLQDDTRLITGGYLDSFAVARLGVFIEEAFGVFIPDSELTVERMDTPAMMVEQVARWEKPRE